jgi:hypothetical protein
LFDVVFCLMLWLLLFDVVLLCCMLCFCLFDVVVVIV